MEYRIWHTSYSYTAQLLIALSRVNVKSRRSVVEKTTRTRAHSVLHINARTSSETMTWDWVRNRYFAGTEALTFTASVLIAAVPFYLFVYSGPGPDDPLSAGFVLSYIVTFLAYAAQGTFRKCAECPWAQWLLHGIYSDLDLTYQAS